MSEVIIDILPDLAAQQALAGEWDAAVPQSFAAVFSQSPWYFAWRDAFPAKEAVVVTARLGDRLVGVLPVAKIRTDARGLYFSEVTNFTGADYQVPVLADGASPEVLPRMLDAAIDHFGREAMYRWANIPDCAGTGEAIAAHLGRRGMEVCERYNVAPRIEIRGRSFKELEASWSANHRTDVRRQRKRLAEKAALTLWQPPDLGSAQSLLEEFFEVHDEKWLAQGHPGRFQDVSQETHFRAIVKRLWGRGLHFSTVRCGPENVSYAIGFFSGGWIQWYRPTYRREYQNYSPGKVHIGLMVEVACREGWQGIDFLGGPEPYKFQWANDQLRTVDYFASARRWSPAYQWFTRGKPYVRNRIGPAYARWKARVQRLRSGTASTKE